MGHSLPNSHELRRDVEHPPEFEQRSVIRMLGTATLWCAWQVIRLPALGLMTILAPIVRLVLNAFALLLTLTAFLFKFATNNPQFPFWGMLGLALGALALLVVFETILVLLSGRSD